MDVLSIIYLLVIVNILVINMIYINSDEPNEIIYEIKRLIPDAVVKKLKVGDYMIKNNNAEIPVERKTIYDHIDSIIDGRYHRQLYEMSTLYSISFFAIIGDILEVEYIDRISIDSFISSIVSIALKKSPDGAKGIVIPVILPSIDYFSKFLIRIDKITSKGRLIRQPTINVCKSDMKELLVGTLSTFPGVGPERAKLILSNVGSLYNLVNMDEDELSKIPYIGPKTAKKIYNYCRLKYVKNQKT